MSQETRFFRRVLAYLFRRTVISFIVKHLIRSIPTPATPPHTRAVATHNIPDPVKHLMKPLQYGQGMDVVWVHRKWTRTKPICFTINSGPVSFACPSIRSTPTYLPIAAFILRIVPLHSSPVLVFLWNQHVRLPEVSVNNALAKIICNTASCTSRIFRGTGSWLRGKISVCVQVWKCCVQEICLSYTIVWSLSKVLGLAGLPKS